jgi:tetratricopeptide (TPR) repeat protein
LARSASTPWSSWSRRWSPLSRAGGLVELERAWQSPLLTSGDRASGLGWASIIQMWLGDLDGATATAEQARAAAAQVGDQMTATVATAMFAVISLLCGQLENADRISDEAVLLADRSPARQGHRYPVSAPRAFILLELDRFEDARSTLDLGSRVSEELGIPWHSASYQMVRAVERFTVGEWDEAVSEVEASVELAREGGETYNLIVSRGVLALIFFHRNDLARAEQTAEVAVRQLAATGARYRAQWAMCAQALVLKAQGKIAEAYATLSESWDLCADLGLALEYRVLGPELVRRALAVGDRERAGAVSAAVAQLAAGNNLPSLTGAARDWSTAIRRS